MKRLHLLFFALLFVLVPRAAAQDPFGSVAGTVKDQQGAVVQNATVAVRSVATNATKTVVTNEDGNYRVLQLQPGIYEIRVSATNFKQSLLENVQVQVGQAASADVTLDIGVASEVVNVSATSETQIERTDNTVSGVVNTRQIENLPLNGRNFLDLAQLQPGTEKVDGGSFDPDKGELYWCFDRRPGRAIDTDHR